MRLRFRLPAILLVPMLLLAVEPCFSSGKEVVYFGVGLRYHPINIYENFQPMMDYLSENTPYRFELKISRDYKETLTSLVEGKTTISSVGDGGLMIAMLHGAVPVVKPLNSRGKPTYRSCIVVPADSSIRSLYDLKGKHIALGSSHSTTGNLLPRKMLADKGVPPEQLGSIQNLRNHDSVARAVAKGEYDAGALKDTVADQYAKHGLLVIAYSDELPSIPLLMNKNAPRRLFEAVSEALLKLDRNNPKHRNIMRNWDPEFRNGFAPLTGAEYTGLLRLFKALPYGCSRGCHR